VHEVIDQLNRTPLASFMLVIATGYALGRASWRGLALGPAGGTLAVAILLGALGLDFQALYGSEAPKLTIGTLGFTLFIYSVGFEAGPRFFASLVGGPGLRFVAVGLVVNVLALVLGIACGWLLDLGGAVTAGAVSGALTSAATYAAALEVVYGKPEVTGPLAVSFALIYPIGLVGIVLLLQILPRARGTDLAREAEDGESARPDVRDVKRQAELFRAFEVTAPEVAGASLAALDLPRRTRCYVTQVHRGDAILPANADTVLETGDHLLVRGRLADLESFSRLVGPEIDDAELRNRVPSARRIVLLASSAAGLALADLDLARRFDCLVVGIERGPVRVEPAADVHVQRGDVLEVVGRRSDVRRAAETLGRLERPDTETNIGVYAAGILLGLLVGRLGFDLAGVDLSLGFAGGLLLSGIFMGWVRRLGPFPTHVPRPARQLVRDLGILLFVAETGVRAGGSSLAALEGRVLPLLACGVFLSVVPVLVALWVACRVLHMRPVDAWGSVCGGMTSSSGLAALQRATDSNAPAVSYAASYAVASVLITIAGRVIMLVMG